jgi:EmrB/QacA subfamily drug resistance transporter
LVDVSDQQREDVPLRYRWLVYGVIIVALLMITVDQTSVATALTALQSDLHTTLAWSSWTVSGYSVGQIVAFPLAGLLADQFGRKSVFLIAIGLFTIASLASGSAQGMGALIACRIVQGLAGGAFIPVGTGIVADYFRRDRDRAIGLFASIVPIGAAVGPVLGGAIVTSWGWRWIFLVNVPLGVTLVFAVTATVRERRRTVVRHVDLPGIVLLVTVLLSGMCAATLGSSTSGAGWRVPVSVAMGLLALVAGWILVRHLRGSPEPLIPLDLLRGRGLGAMHVVNLLFGSAAFGLIALLPHYAQARFGLTSVFAGGLLGLRAVGMMCASTLGVLLIRRIGFRPLLLAGFVVHSVGLVVLAFPPPHVGVTPWIILGATISGVGVGLASPASNNAAMHLAPDRVSSVSGLRGMFRQVGAILAISSISPVVSASAEPVTAQAIAFAVLAVALLIAVPIILRIPSYRGRW